MVFGFSFFDFFVDPLLRGPMLGTLLMCIGSSLIGVVLLLKKKTLLSEALSHSTYPGVLIALILFSTFFSSYPSLLPLLILVGALSASFTGLIFIEWLEKRQKIHPDTALCFILSLFFGIGTVLGSGIQRSLPSIYSQIPVFLFGQAATMNDLHIILYGCLSLFIALFFFLIFKPMQALLFDRQFSYTLGIPIVVLERTLFALLVVSLVLGMRSVGIMLISAMTVGPAIAARAFSDRLKMVFCLALLFGIASAVLGNILSVWGTVYLSTEQELINLPTGPMIVVVSSLFAFFSLLLAPKKGLVFRVYRMIHFNLRCLEENLLKIIWRKRKVSSVDLKKHHATSSLLFLWTMRLLKKKGWVVQNSENEYETTLDGDRKAASIVRLHRLWELYLSSELCFEDHKIHADAEKMEHILTPVFEQQLTALLDHPTQDPHQQPIPENPVRF